METSRVNAALDRLDRLDQIETVLTSEQAIETNRARQELLDARREQAADRRRR